MTLQAIKLKGRIGPDRRIEITEGPAELPEGEVEVIVLYRTEILPSPKGPAERPVLTLPARNLGRFLGGTLRREELYDDDGR